MYRSPFMAQARCTCAFKKAGSWAAGYHTGEDWVCANRKLVSPVSGVIVRNQYDRSYGYYLVIRTDDDKSILMAHLAAKSVVMVGQRVVPGDYVGQMGNSGHSSGAHLHIEVQNSRAWEYNKNLCRPSLYIDFTDWGDDEVKKKIKIKLNGVTKNVTAIESEGHNYVKLQDLRDAKIAIGYDNAHKMATVDAK